MRLPWLYVWIFASMAILRTWVWAIHGMHHDWGLLVYVGISIVAGTWFTGTAYFLDECTMAFKRFER